MVFLIQIFLPFYKKSEERENERKRLKKKRKKNQAVRFHVPTLKLN